MHFKPDTQALGCDYCGSSIEINSQAGDIKEYNFETGEALCSTDWGSQTKVIQCENCGAKTILEAHNTAQHCAFCDSSHVVNIDEVPGIKPESLIPFKVSTEKAKQVFSKWINQRFFAPKKLKGNHQMSHLKGVYIPYWTYDTQTHSAYKGEKGTYYYVNETVWVTRNGKKVSENKRVRKTRWEPTRGTYQQFFDDELIHGSKQLDASLAGKFSTFNLIELVEYKPDYLSGFIAEKYSIGLKEGWDTAKLRIKEKIRQGIIRKINGDEVRNLQVNTSYTETTFKHILLPIWISAYAYQGKNYQFMINGQTGEVVGKAPVSIPKVMCVSIIAVLILGFILRWMGAF